MLVPKVVTALRTLIPLDEVRTDGRDLLLEGKWKHTHPGPLGERVPYPMAHLSAGKGL